MSEKGECLVRSIADFLLCRLNLFLHRWFFFSFLHSTLNNMECVRGLTAELCTKKCTHNELHANIRFNMKIPNYRVSMRIFPSHVTGYIKASVENFNQIFFLKLLFFFLFHSDDERATHSSIVLLSFTQ